MTELFTWSIELFSGIDFESITRIATVIGLLLTVVAIYAIRLLYSSAKDSKKALDTMREEFKVLMANQADLKHNQIEITKVCHEIRGGIRIPLPLPHVADLKPEVDLFMGTYGDIDCPDHCDQCCDKDCCAHECCGQCHK
jgi:hypothetical protein